MGTALMQQADAAVAIAEQDQILTQMTHAPRRATGIARQRHWMPIAAHQLAHRRAGADFGQLGQIGRRLAPITRPDVDFAWPGMRGLRHARSSLSARCAQKYPNCDSRDIATTSEIWSRMHGLTAGMNGCRRVWRSD